MAESEQKTGDTSVDNLQAREYWQEQHTKDQQQQQQQQQQQGSTQRKPPPRPKSAVQNYQRQLSTSKPRRQPHTARVPDIEVDSDDEGPATFVNSKQVRKDHNYYRRKGALWTDPDVHVPESRKHLLGLRPDLEKKHDKYVQSVVRREKHAAMQVMDHQSRARMETQALMRQRQEENLRAEEKALNWGRELSNQSRSGEESAVSFEQMLTSSRPSTTSSRTRQGVLKKDWKFYRRQGALWTDLVHLPPERLHFVLRPKIVKMDRDATLRIKEKYEEEIDREYASREIKMKRANKIRQDFIQTSERRREIIKEQWGRDPPFSLGRTGLSDNTGGATGQSVGGGGLTVEEDGGGERGEGGGGEGGDFNNRIMYRRRHPTTRTDELAQPKSASAKRPSTSVGQSYYGLLSADTTVGPLLQEHWGRQGYDIHQSGKINVTDSITSTDEVRVAVGEDHLRRRKSSRSSSRSGAVRSSASRGSPSRGSASRGSPSRGSARSVRGGGSTHSQREASSRATTSKGRHRPRPAFNRSQQEGGRPSTAPNASFTGSATGGYQGARAAPPYDANQRGGGSRSGGSRSGGGGPRGGSQIQRGVPEGSTEFVVEVTASSGSAVHKPARDALEAIMELDSFDLKRREEERKKAGRHENWFAKPYISSGKKAGGRPSTAGALSRPPNYFRDMSDSTSVGDGK